MSAGFRPRSLVITGASSGLGAALARLYAAPGVRLGLVGRNAPRLEAVAAVCRLCGAETATLSAVVGEAEPLAAWLQEFDRAAPLDLVVANAGTSAGAPPGEAVEPPGVAARQIRTNLLGVVHTVEPVLPHLVRRGAGRIAIIASIAGLRGLPYCAAYSASKAGARAYGEGLRAALRGSGVGVTVVCPGFIDTPMTDRFVGAKPGLIGVARGAAIVHRGIARGRARIAFPRTLALGLSCTDLLPAWLGDRILRRHRFHIVPG